MEVTNKNIFSQEFIPWIIKWGRGLNLLGVVLCFTPCLGLALQGVFPPWDAFLQAFLIQFPLSATAYIREPISYFAVLGIPGTYMSFLSGNISNLRLPASSVAQAAAGVTEGSDEGTIIATLGIAASTMVNILILSAGVMFGAGLLAMLPPKVTTALNLLLPALFASLLGNYIFQKPKLALFGVPLAGIVVFLHTSGYLNFIPEIIRGAAVVLICTFGTMGYGISMAKKGKL